MNQQIYRNLQAHPNIYRILSLRNAMNAANKKMRNLVSARKTSGPEYNAANRRANAAYRAYSNYTRHLVSSRYLQMLHNAIIRLSAAKRKRLSAILR